MSTEQARTTSAASLDRDALLKDLQRQVEALRHDLRERAEREPGYADRLRQEYERAAASERTTAGMFESWLEERLVQIAAAWVLSCVFVRFCEDNLLIPEPWLSGPGDRLAEAQDRYDAFFRRSPELNDRDWLLASFATLREAHPTTAGLFDERFNPLYEAMPSYGAASGLLAFWRERGADGEVRYDFSDQENLDTRFLGDLYQDLSEHARKTYALLQTPVFVEEFILDLTLEPAVEEFGLDPVWGHQPSGWTGEVDEDGQARGLRCIDPACGSGHFLLGLFDRLLAKWRELEPGTENWTLVRRALESVHGTDKNPFAVSIARFRMLVAAMKECRVRELRGAPAMPIRVAVADSLLHGRADGGEELAWDFDGPSSGSEAFTYQTEDVNEYVKSVDILGRGSYHVVVANPPYITVKDETENRNYRKAYFACSGKYALSVPFAQRIFELAVRAGGSRRDGGFTGQITSNSFMKREFGKVLIESYFHGGPYKDPVSRHKRDFAGVELTHVIDTSGAYIPGHGTPTVILAGRNQVARQAQPIRTVLGVRGEPGVPEDGGLGSVWVAITKQVGRPGSESEWVSVEDAPRERFAEHPWSLSGGGADRVFDAIEAAATLRLKAQAFRVGVFGIPGADEAMIAPRATFTAAGIPGGHIRALVVGDELREWRELAGQYVFFPYSSKHEPLSIESLAVSLRWMWPNRTELGNRATFSRETYFEAGRPWHEWHQLPKDIGSNQWFIAYAEVATHNNFVLDRGGKVFKQTAPIIKLPESAGEAQHLELLGLLNSSTACFWMKEVSHLKGGSGIGRGVQDEPWEDRYAFSSTRLQEFPLPISLPLVLGRALDTLAQQLASHEPAVLAASAVPTRARLDVARAAYEAVGARMIVLQEELDWTVYGSYGLLSAKDVAAATIPLPEDPSSLTDADVPALALGQRAFEIVMARRQQAGDLDTAWFERHRSTPITEIPTTWPESYRRVVQARLDLIEANKDIRLIERPEYKRRWSSEPWEKREAAALRAWLLDAAERRHLWFEERDDFVAPRVLTVNQLADALRHDEDVQSVAALYAADHLGKRDASLAAVYASVLDTEHVPYLSALRYKEAGLRKRRLWEQVWELQREEDRTGESLGISVPPKYTGADFLKHSYWSNRGKLDVPKERFVSYPGASPDNDPSLLLGWAGWNHREQAEVLVHLLNDRVERDGWTREDPRFVPLLAGLQEVMPWVAQWYDQDDPEWGGNPAEEFRTMLRTGREERHLSEADLENWRPERKRGSR
ncbi:BREX-2 system adenine-specific DNA-methyltransferase PglX [Streptacidiphilus neutrinimicus]|uniref:BREX-2 system adenine-specific DNA-methyltransferase PglX n=1 Tax=Streptacidiphilus neutrinimicus TaxID=105420 RepID=UPI0005A7A75D|nr:BREX-2 system adenine-specific DNA-methyltransferase PglX [Streptacidiphilus neutrinimicus]